MASSLLGHCSQVSCESLLHEVIVCVGYFTVNHPDNQIKHTLLLSLGSPEWRGIRNGDSYLEMAYSICSRQLNELPAHYVASYHYKLSILWLLNINRGSPLTDAYNQTSYRVPLWTKTYRSTEDPPTSGALGCHSKHRFDTAAKGTLEYQSDSGQLPAPLSMGTCLVHLDILTGDKPMLVWKAVKENLHSPPCAVEVEGKETSQPNNSLTRDNMKDGNRAPNTEEKAGGRKEFALVEFNYLRFCLTPYSTHRTTLTNGTVCHPHLHPAGKAMQEAGWQPVMEVSSGLVTESSSTQKGAAS
ncbi:hypothetical protein P7K49_017329 [Saguinus oedipus]|uniref:Uncharacterized protein n=1 Tax=Saguinus oedipus TaxID=9490 RepID=A0ABQ9V268_SAGOE|nr:hypothetical protein P7K49_017329 [Saguinus oedipus]